MHRMVAGVEYFGASYHGWQMQKHSDQTVQEQVEKALGQVANKPVRIICAGRTDAGVHASEQVIHFDIDVDRTNRSWVYGANSNLPKDICLLWAMQSSDDFHARFSALRRRYCYIIFNRNIRPTFNAYRTTWCHQILDENLMHEAAKHLIGSHDFSSYRALGCQAKSPVREIYHLSVARKGAYVLIDIEANAFLHHMVRNIAGVLMDIGKGKQPPIWAKEVLQYRDRCLGGVTAAPFGLYLTNIRYPQKYGLPKLSPSLPIW